MFGLVQWQLSSEGALGFVQDLFDEPYCQSGSVKWGGSRNYGTGHLGKYIPMFTALCYLAQKSRVERVDVPVHRHALGFRAHGFLLATLAYPW